MLVWEVPYYPADYLPIDVRGDLLVATAMVTHSPSRGDADHFTVKAGGQERSRPRPGASHDSPIEALRDLVRFDWGGMDAWFEEDEEVFVHPRDPYRRVDILPSRRAVYESKSTGSPWPSRPTLGCSSRRACRCGTTSPSPMCGWTCWYRRRRSPAVRTRAPPGTGRRGSATRPGEHRLELSDAASREHQGRRPGRLLQRARRHLGRRRTRNTTKDTILLTTHETGSAFADSVGTTKGGPT